MRGIKVTQEIKEEHKIFKNHPLNTYYIGENLSIEGAKEVIFPEMTALEKLGQVIESENSITYGVVPKTPEDIEQEKIEKQKVEKEKIKQKYIDMMVSDAVSPTDALILFKEWEPRLYANKEGAVYKGKPFRNTIEGNINAPDKGGWIEIK